MTVLELALSDLKRAYEAMENARETARQAGVMALDEAGVTDGFELVYTPEFHQSRKYRVRGIEPNEWDRGRRGNSVHARILSNGEPMVTVSCIPLKADGTRHQSASQYAIPIEVILAAKAAAE